MSACSLASCSPKACPAAGKSYARHLHIMHVSFVLHPTGLPKTQCRAGSSHAEVGHRTLLLEHAWHSHSEQQLCCRILAQESSKAPCAHQTERRSCCRATAVPVSWMGSKYEASCMMNLVLSFSSRARLPRPFPGRPSARTWPKLRREAHTMAVRLQNCSAQQAICQAICQAGHLPDCSRTCARGPPTPWWSWR